MKFSKISFLVASGKKINTLYKTDARFIRGDVIAIAKNEIYTELWHKKLVHISENGLQILAKKYFLSNIKGMKLIPYTHYFMGKQ